LKKNHDTSKKGGNCCKGVKGETDDPSGDTYHHWEGSAKQMVAQKERFRGEWAGDGALKDEFLFLGTIKRKKKKNKGEKKKRKQFTYDGVKSGN